MAAARTVLGSAVVQPPSVWGSSQGDFCLESCGLGIVSVGYGSGRSLSASLLLPIPKHCVTQQAHHSFVLLNL